MKQEKKNIAEETTSIDISSLSDKTDTLENVVIRHKIEEEEEKNLDKDLKSNKIKIIILIVLLLIVLGVIVYLLLN